MHKDYQEHTGINTNHLSCGSFEYFIWICSIIYSILVFNMHISAFVILDNSMLCIMFMRSMQVVSGFMPVPALTR